MPTVTLNKTEFEKIIGKKLPIEKLKDRISYLGTDLEGIEGNEITVEIFPDRPDMLSEQGLGRALSSFIGVHTGLRHYNVKKSGEKLIVDGPVKDVRPYTACAIVKNLHFTEEKIREIIQIQEKLHTTFCRNRRKAAIGIYPFEKIKTPIYYKALKPEEIKFRPLDFPRVINGRQILSQHPAGKEYGYLLEKCSNYPVFIDSNKNILSMPPIINSELTGKVTEKTKDVFIECSGFDFVVLNELLNILVCALADMGGDVCSMEVVYRNKKFTTPDLSPRKMKMNLDYINKILGLKLKEADAKKLLERMGYGYSNKTVLVPAYRADILHEIDLAEDIAKAYGYENFKPEMPNISTIGEENNIEKFKNRIANIMVGLGLLEVNTYDLDNKDNQCKKMLLNVDVVEIENPSTKEYGSLRFWITPCLLGVLGANKHNEYPQNIFDIGAVFKKGNSETGIEESARVCIALCDTKTDFTKIKQVLDYLFNALSLKYEIIETEHPSFIKGRVGRIIVNGKKVAYIGEIHPQVLKNFDLEMPVSVLEINLSELFEIIH